MDAPDEDTDHPFAALAAILARTERPGSFHGSGTEPTSLPRVDIEGFGPLPLPLIPAVVQLLDPHTEPAPYGRGNETLVDEAVRRCRQIDGSKIRVDSRWNETLDAITDAAARQLGADGEVTARLYKLLLYGPGDFFVPHRDTEKEPGMFATLVVVLPSNFDGGELVIEHGDETVSLPLRSDSVAEVAWGAFYADCRHELLPLRSGYRAVLVYNLVRTGGALPAPDRRNVVAAIQRELRAWEVSAWPAKLCALLEHRYTSAELTWDTLKGADRARAAALRTAAESLGFQVEPALVRITEEWSAEEVQYSRRWRRRDPDPSKVELYDLVSERYTVRWADDDNWERYPLGFDETELCPAGSLKDAAPDEQSYHEATGNEGATVERTYRRAAIVTWPFAHEVRVLAQKGLVPVIDALAQDDGTGPVDELAIEAARVVEHVERQDRDIERLFTELLRLECTVGATALLRRLAELGRLPRRGVEHAAEALRLLAAPDAAAVVEELVVAQGHTHLGLSGALLSSCAGWLPPEHLRAPAEALIALLEREPPRNHWGPVRIDADVLTATLRASLAHTDLCDRLFVTAVARPQQFSFDNTFLTAVLRNLSEATLEDPRIRWAEHCVQELRPRQTDAIVAPTNFRRDGPTRCDCRICSELAAFMADGSAKVYELSARADLRGHAEGMISRDRLDLITSTVKRGSPHKLRCVKTTASYDRAVQQRKHEQEALATLEPWLAAARAR